MTGFGLFLDRDGTINEEVDFVTSAKGLHLIPGSAEAIREANELGLTVIIITNQSGVARGLLTEDQLLEIHKSLLDKLDDAGAHIDAIYYCPHHPEFGVGEYRIDCQCRKPRTGMLTMAAKEFSLDLARSFVIGDRMIDVQTGNNAGASSVLVLTGYGRTELELCKENGARVAHVAEDLKDAMNYVRSAVRQPEPQP